MLNGSKLWITNGMFADFGIVVARTFSETSNGELSLFLVERDVTPYSATPVETMFTRSTGTAAFTFENAEVPAANLLGQEGQGLRQILIGLNFGRLNVAMGAVGAAQCALDLSLDYALQRKQFGRQIGSFQLVQKHIVDMTMKTQAARSLGYRAARRCRTAPRARNARSPSCMPPKPRLTWPTWPCRYMAAWAMRPATRSSAFSATPAAG